MEAKEFVDGLNDGKVFYTKDGQSWIGFSGQECPEELNKATGNWRFLRADGQSFSNNLSSVHSLVGLWDRHRSQSDRVVGYWYDGAENRSTILTLPTAAKTIERFGCTWTLIKGGRMPAELANVKVDEWQYLDYTFSCIHTPGKHAGWVGYWNGNTPIAAIRIIEKAMTAPEVETFEAAGKTWVRCDSIKDGMPAALAYVGGFDWETITPDRCVSIRDCRASYPGYWKNAVWNFVGYRILSAVPVAPRKPKHKSPSTIRTQAAFAEKMANAAMIKADGESETPEAKQSKLIDALAGNGNIFAPPKRTVHPLFRVTPMTTTGHVLWGAEHLEG